jgi:DinB family protein
MVKSTVTFIRGALEQSRARLLDRLEGIGEAEYFWEPVAGCWSVRRRVDAVTKLANGRGEWVLDYDLPDPDPAPFTTIAWRVIHLALVHAGYVDEAFGPGGDVPWDNYEIPFTAREGIAFYGKQVDRLLIPLGQLADHDLERQVVIPWWSKSASLAVVYGVALDENSHHGAEVGVLRDLYRGVAFHKRRSTEGPPGEHELAPPS